MDEPTPDRAHAVGILRYLAFAGLALIALMVTLEPDVGFAAPPSARLLFWTLQVATGLCVLQLVLHLLARRLGASRLPSWSLVLLSGVLGAVLLAPVYWLIGEGLMQAWLGYPALPDDEAGTLAALGPINPLLREYVDIVGPVTTAWALICLPRLHWLVPPVLQWRPRPDVATPLVAPASARSDASLDATTARPDSPISSQPGTSPDDGSVACTGPSPELDAPPSASALTQPRETWCERLPAELGTDVIAVASELQYLRVWTTRGCALILGALADVETAGASRGLRVHRSWWVACEHVVSVRRSATGVVCLMSDGRQVPVSRRRRAEVLGRFGDGARYRVADDSKSVSQTDLD